MRRARWCTVAIGIAVVVLVVAAVLGWFDLDKLTSGGTRTIIAASVALVLAMLVASGCRTGDDDATAKTNPSSRNKTTS